MIEMILELLLGFIENISASGHGGSRSRRRDIAMIAIVVAAVLLALCAYCLIRGWQTNDAGYLVIGFLCLILTLFEIVRLIRRWRKR